MSSKGSSASINKYEEYQSKCIQYLNELIKHCPEVNEQSDGKGPQGQGPQGQGPQGQGPQGQGLQGQGPQGPKSPDDEDPKNPKNPKTPDGKDPVEADKSSTVLKHNGQVGSLEELIVFLIKAPIKDDLIKMKLNDVYKIFNPTARDIVSKTDPSSA